MRPDILPGDRSKKAQETRRKMRTEIIRKMAEAQDAADKYRERLDDFPCVLCGQSSCPKNCW